MADIPWPSQLQLEIEYDPAPQHSFSFHTQYPPPKQHNTPKPRPSGACQRCKGLKVRCEFKSEHDPCKRCMNGGHECVVPGKKKRRVPPKREHLLNQIRQQADQIQNLMAQLELTHSRPSAHTDLADPHSPSDPPPAPTPAPDLEDWMSRARASLHTFGGLLGAAGATRGALLGADPEADTPSTTDDDTYPWEDAIDHNTPPPPTHDPRLLSPTSPLPRSLSPSTQLPGAQKLVSLPTEASPFGLIADLALKKPRAPRRPTPDPVPAQHTADPTPEVGVASDDFFRPSPGPDPLRLELPAPEDQYVPHILARRIISPQEAEQLFQIYYDYMNLSVSLLDPVLYTTQKTVWRSPFLFTVICAIASRHYRPRPGLYDELMHYAQLAAGTALIGGHKSIEMCQAYMLLSLYPVPARRWEEDRRWIYLGLAIRIAIDLNLHHPSTVQPVDEAHAREVLNRTRVWLNCFNLDRSTGSEYGKAPTIPPADFVAGHAGAWWQSSPYNMHNFDIHICAYNAELRVVGAFHAKLYSDPNHPTGLNKELDIEALACETDDALVALGHTWLARLAGTDLGDAQNRFRTGLLRLAYSYARLVVLSRGFQYVFGREGGGRAALLQRCLRAASDVVKAIVEDAGRPEQRIYLRHGPEAQSVFVTFACAFLVKLLQPKFSLYLHPLERLEIRRLVQSVVDLLGCADVAIDARHGPRLYARFLAGLLETPMAQVSPPAKARRRRGAPAAAGQEGAGAFEPEGSASPRTAGRSSASVSPLAAPPAPLAFDGAFDGAFAGAPDAFGFPAAPAAAEGAGPDDFMSSLQHALGMSAAEFFQPPLPFDGELLQSMQQLGDPMWQDMAVPGFGWMSQMHAPQTEYAGKGAEQHGGAYPLGAHGFPPPA